MHETFEREEETSLPSERSFGLLMGGVLGVLALLNWWHVGRVWPWLAGVAALFLLAALFWSAVLQPLNKAWYKLGLLLNAVVSPIVMGLLFYGAVWPTGMFLRLRGRDLLRLKLDTKADTYWIRRQPAGPSPESLKDQF
jgi:hypothetical protein